MQRHAAKHLLDERDERLYRSSCTRAYYAAYAAITSHIPPATPFAHGWRNPAHAALPGHVDQIAGMSAARKDAVRVALAQLRQRREDADYRPAVSIGRSFARESWRDLATILALLP
ncbi:MAG: hypothetical protein WBD40_22510 [Tepidisphaeraceae bacterium]